MTYLFISPVDQRRYEFLLTLSKARLIETAQRERNDIAQALILRMTKADLAEAIVKKPGYFVSRITGEMHPASAITAI